MLSIVQVSTLVAGLAAVQTSFAAPAHVSSNVVDVIPGPGLPSLESLGWNATYIHSLPDPVLSFDDKRSLEARAGSCGTSYGNVDNAVACYKYLNGLGTKNCAVPDSARSAIMCTSGSVHVQADGIGQHSYCRDVASAVLWVINSCTRPSHDTAGHQAAAGNGGLIITTSHV